MKVILKKDEFHELNKEYKVYKIENNKIYLNQHRWVSPTLVEKYIEGENMKTTIYELLGMIKDNKAPKRILFKDKQWEYSEEDYDYIDIFNGWLFDEYVVTYILNEEVTILETTIKPDLGTIICYKKGETDNAGYVGVVDKINEDGSVCLKQNDKIEKISIKDMKIQAESTGNYCYSISQPMKIIINKVNEIIDKVNKDA